MLVAQFLPRQSERLVGLAGKHLGDGFERRAHRAAAARCQAREVHGDGMILGRSARIYARRTVTPDDQRLAFIGHLSYRIDTDAIVIADVFQKTTQQTPKRVIDDCRRRLRQYDALSE